MLYNPEAILYLEDGISFQGRSLATTGETAGEVVFNTAMTGYQEILTDPSYAGQIVAMTYPLIGNTGVNDEDVESNKIHVRGFVVKEFCRHHSNFRATQSLIEYLDQHHIIAMEGIDTRALTRHLRLSGAMKGIISTEDFDKESLARKLKAVPDMVGWNLVDQVTTKEKYVWKSEGPAKFKVAAIDCGIKFNILRILAHLGCEVHVFPSRASLVEVMAIHPMGFLSPTARVTRRWSRRSSSSCRRPWARFPPSASAWAIKLWAWPSEAKRISSNSAITGPIIRSRI